MSDEGRITIDVFYDESDTYACEEKFKIFMPFSNHKLSDEQKVSKTLERLDEWNRGPAKARMIALLEVHRGLSWLEEYEMLTTFHHRFQFIDYNYKTFAEDFSFLLYSLGARRVTARLYGYDKQITNDDCTNTFQEEFVLDRSLLWTIK